MSQNHKIFIFKKNFWLKKFFSKKIKFLKKKSKFFFFEIKILKKILKKIKKFF